MTQQLYDSLVAILGAPIDVIQVAENDIVALWQPVTDRTLDDCVYGNRRGCFDHVCINRISANLEYVHVYMYQHGFVVPEYYKTHLYLRTDYFKADEYNSFVDKYIWVAEQFGFTEPVPRKVPELTALLYTDVNDLETIIFASKEYGDRLDSSFIYSGEAFSGEW